MVFAIVFSFGLLRAPVQCRHWLEVMREFLLGHLGTVQIVSLMAREGGGFLCFCAFFFGVVECNIGAWTFSDDRNVPWRLWQTFSVARPFLLSVGLFFL